MSQAGALSSSGGSGPLPPTVATSYITDDGTAIPSANILNVLGGTGIDTYANPDLSDNLIIRLSNSGSVTTQTIGAVTSEVTIINLGATPSIGIFVCRVVGFDAGGSNNGCGYVLTAAAKTDGAVASIVQAQDKLIYEDAAFAAADANVTVNGNAVTITVLGVAGFTINWVLETNFTAS
jgi:hypothetical protein